MAIKRGLRLSVQQLLAYALVLGAAELDRILSALRRFLSPRPGFSGAVKIGDVLIAQT